MLQTLNSLIDISFSIFFFYIKVMDTRNMRIEIPDLERAQGLKDKIQRDGALFRKVFDHLRVYGVSYSKCAFKISLTI